MKTRFLQLAEKKNLSHNSKLEEALCNKIFELSRSFVGPIEKLRVGVVFLWMGWRKILHFQSLSRRMTGRKRGGVRGNKLIIVIGVVIKWNIAKRWNVQEKKK